MRCLYVIMHCAIYSSAYLQNNFDFILQIHCYATHFHFSQQRYTDQKPYTQTLTSLSVRQYIFLPTTKNKTIKYKLKIFVFRLKKEELFRYNGTIFKSTATKSLNLCRLENLFGTHTHTHMERILHLSYSLPCCIKHFAVNFVTQNYFLVLGKCVCVCSLRYFYLIIKRLYANGYQPPSVFGNTKMVICISIHHRFI